MSNGCQGVHLRLESRDFTERHITLWMPVKRKRSFFNAGISRNILEIQLSACFIRLQEYFLHVKHVLWPTPIFRDWFAPTNHWKCGWLKIFWLQRNAFEQTSSKCDRQVASWFLKTFTLWGVASVAMQNTQMAIMWTWIIRRHGATEKVSLSNTKVSLEWIICG